MKTMLTSFYFQLKKVLTPKKGFVVHLFLVMLITIICWGWGIHQPGLGYPDEAAHLMDGAFIRDIRGHDIVAFGFSSQLLRIPVVFSGIISSQVAIFTNFILNDVWTFESRHEQPI